MILLQQLSIVLLPLSASVLQVVSSLSMKYLSKVIPPKSLRPALSKINLHSQQNMVEKHHQSAHERSDAAKAAPRFVATKGRSKPSRQWCHQSFLSSLTARELKQKNNHRCARVCALRARVRAPVFLLSLVFCLSSDAMCINPIPAFVRGTTFNGKQKIVFKSAFGDVAKPDFMLPCGKCLGCQVDKRNRWISRLQLELLCHDNVGTFITLTYADAPFHLVKKDVQDFLKRFRNLPRDLGISIPDNFKYFFCGEYGSKFKRPHYHGLLFGVDCFSDAYKTDIVTFKNNYPIYSSSVLADRWRKGFITVDKISHANIKYVSKYILKKYQSGGDEFTLKSIGLGADFFFRFPDKRSNPLPSTFFPDYSLGTLHTFSKSGKPVPLAIPYKAFDRYCEMVNPSLCEVLKARRKYFVTNHKPTYSDLCRHRDWLEVTTAIHPTERILDYDS